MFQPEALPPFNSNRMDSYSQVLLTILNNDTDSLAAFNECIEIIDEAEFDKSDKQDVKLLSKTKNLVEKANEKTPHNIVYKV
jgi:transcriptional regulator